MPAILSRQIIAASSINYLSTLIGNRIRYVNHKVAMVNVSIIIYSTNRF